MATSRTNETVTFHREGFGGKGRPAVNVKVRGGRIPLPLELGRISVDGGKTTSAVTTDPEFTWEWMDENVSDAQQNELFDVACQDGWATLQTEAAEIFGPNAKVYSEGRSSGWAIVDGIPDFDDWEDEDLEKWQRFEEVARGAADDIPRAIVELIYFNVFEPQAEAAAAKAASTTVYEVWSNGVAGSFRKIADFDEAMTYARTLWDQLAGEENRSFPSIVEHDLSEYTSTKETPSS